MDLQKQYRLNAYLAILVGLGLIIGETVRRYGDWGYWARWMDDYIMGFLLICSAILILRNNDFGKKLLIVGWSFSIGMLYGSFFFKLVSETKEFNSNIETNLLIFLIGLAFFSSIFGLVWLLMIGRRAQF